MFKRITQLAKSVLVLSTLCLFFILPFQSATAQNTSLQVQGLGIDPFLIELDMSPGQTVSRKITLTNTTDKPLTFSASINDFVSSGNTGQPIFLDSNEESDPKYSLSKWITVTQQPDFTIAAKGSTEIEFTVSVPVDAEPGTHYGGILFGQLLGVLNNTGTAVQHKAGAIILVRLGKSQEQVQVHEFFTQRTVYQHSPIEFISSLHNFGNVHSKVKGDIKIRNMFGRQVSEVPVNPDAQSLHLVGTQLSQFYIMVTQKLSYGQKPPSG